MQASTIPAFKTALKVLLDAAISTAEVYYGTGDPEQMAESAVIIGPARSDPLAFTCGMTQANETYDIDVISSVARSSVEPYETLVEEAYALNDQVVAAVLGWDTLPTGVNNVIPAESDDTENVGDGWREAAVKQRIRVTGRR